MYLTSFTRKDFCCLEFLRFHSVIFLDFLEKEEKEREIGISSNPKTKERSKITHLNGNNRQLKHREVAAGALVGHFTARGIYGNRAEACVCVHKRQGRGHAGHFSFLFLCTCVCLSTCGGDGQSSAFSHLIVIVRQKEHDKTIVRECTHTIIVTRCSHA